MNPKLVDQLGRRQRLQVINALKRTQGLTVKQLAKKFDMSYMGIKQHCDELAKEGYLNTVERKQEKGRPTIVYRLGPKAHDLFPVSSNRLSLDVLEALSELYGMAAPDKVLYTVFQKQADSYKAQAKGETLEQKARWWVELREKEGYMAELEHAKDDSLKILEFNSPIRDLIERYPIAERPGDRYD